MKQTIVLSIVALVFLFLTVQSQRPEKSVLIADPYYWTLGEGNLGLEITGNFQSEELLKETLNLAKEIGTFRAKKYPHERQLWLLRDILVSLDFNATGSVAIWRVSGPKPLLQEYLSKLQKQHKDRSVFYDFGVKEINFKPSRD